MNQYMILSLIAVRYWLRIGLLYFQIGRVREYEIEDHLLSSSSFFVLHSISPLRAKTIRRSVNGCIFWASFQQSSSPGKKEVGERGKPDARWKRKKRTIDGDEVGRERSLVNARENWLLNLAAGMSAAHPPSPSSPSRWRPQTTTTTTTFSRSFPLGPANRQGGENEKLLRSGTERRDEGAKTGTEWKAIVDDVEAYGPPHRPKIREATLRNGLP